MQATNKTQSSSKNRSYRFYGYANKQTDAWIAQQSKKFGSKAAFLNALLASARKNKLNIAAPAVRAKATKRRQVAK